MIKQIIPAITPDNIKDIQLLKDSMDIFLDYLVENSDITIDIKNILDEKKELIYEEFVKIYLNNIYNVLKSPKHNEALLRKLRTLYNTFGLNIEDIDLSIDIVGLLTKDFIMTNKDYKSAKGTPKAMKYIYDIIIESGVQKDFLGSNAGGFRYYEGDHIFEYHVEGTLLAEVYEHFCKPLTHPVGWAYFYKKLLYLAFTDYFDVDFIYTFREVKVKCMGGNLFEEDDYLNNISHFKARYDADPNYGNIITAKRDDLILENITLDPTSEEYKSNIRLINIYNKTLIGDFTLVSDSTITFINSEYIGLPANSLQKRTVYFVNGEILEAMEIPRNIILYDNNGGILIDYAKDYNGNCGLFMDYDVETNTTVTDEISFGLDFPLASTTGKQNIIGAGNVFFDSFIIGDELVNKDVSVTYSSVTGEYDGTNFARIYTPGGVNSCFSNWDMSGVTFDDILQFDICRDSFNRYAFLNLSQEELNLLTPNAAKEVYVNFFNGSRNFDSFIWDEKKYLESGKLLYGYTARDDFSIEII